jgi:anti-anti-sigma regulatory factor/PAS domain-containing protein
VIPVWVYDHEELRFRWANQRALELWRAASLEEFLGRDVSSPSDSTRTRLDNYLLTLRGGGQVSEDWTLYPRGQPATMTLHGSGVQLDDGRLAILFQAVQKEQPIEPSMIRGVEALRHTTLMVSIADEQGAAVFHNPAALRVFGNAPSLADRFADRGAELLASVRAGEVFQRELPVQTIDGEHWHSLRATPITDPVSGTRAVLVQQLDIDKRRRAEDLAAAQSRLVEELNRTVAVVEAQRQEILMLSAPILDVAPETIAVPLIGNVTAERLLEIEQRVLPAVQSERRRFVILDLTGCGTMDQSGARSLVRFTAAVELLGSRCILTGITPSLAQALVTARLELTRLISMRSLSEGMDYCRRALSRTRAPVGETR